MWATYPESEINDVDFYDAKGNFIYQRKWDAITDGSIFYQSLILYCKSLSSKRTKPKGLVIGTHDGEFGEWVPVVENRDANVVLVEATDEQFNKLKQNYKNYSLVKPIKNLVTPNGGDIEFFYGGEGYTNTVVEKVIRHWEKEEIKSCSSKLESKVKQNATTLNEKFKTYSKTTPMPIEDKRKEYIKTTGELGETAYLTGMLAKDENLISVGIVAMNSAKIAQNVLDIANTGLSIANTNNILSAIISLSSLFGLKRDPNAYQIGRAHV